MPLEVLRKICHQMNFHLSLPKHFLTHLICNVSFTHWLSYFSGKWESGYWKWVTIRYSRAPSQTRDWTLVFCFGRWVLYHWASWGAGTFAHVRAERRPQRSLVERHVLLATPLGNVGSVGYLFVSSVKGVGVAFVVSPRLLLISVEFLKQWTSI